jgi:hypothetical protein
MRDLHTEEWFTFNLVPCTEPISIQDLEAGIKTHDLRPVVSAFVSNARTVFLIQSFAPSVFAAGKIAQLAETMAYEAITGKPFNSSPPPQIVPNEVAAMRDKILNGEIKPPSPLAGSASFPEIKAGYKMLGLGHSVELLMSMHVVIAWTLFETLFADLWEAALNAHPIGLSDLKGYKPKSETSEDTSGRFVKTIVLQKFNFDLRHAMGTLLKDKFKFTRLNTIRDAYKAAFHEHSNSINDALANPSLGAISVMRNVIVHKAGICDDEYKKKAQQLVGLIPQLDIGAQLELDGKILYRVLKEALQSSVELIRAVDAWIVAH